MSRSGIVARVICAVLRWTAADDYFALTAGGDRQAAIHREGEIPEHLLLRGLLFRITYELPEAISEILLVGDAADVTPLGPRDPGAVEGRDRVGRPCVRRPGPADPGEVGRNIPGGQYGAVGGEDGRRGRAPHPSFRAASGLWR